LWRKITTPKPLRYYINFNPRQDTPYDHIKKERDGWYYIDPTYVPVEDSTSSQYFWASHRDQEPYQGYAMDEVESVTTSNFRRRPQHEDIPPEYHAYLCPKDYAAPHIYDKEYAEDRSVYDHNVKYVLPNYIYNRFEL